MLRIVIALALVFAVVWYMLKDGREASQEAARHAEKIEVAEQAVKATEDIAAQMATQTDAIRDQALGREPPPAEDDAAGTAGE